MCDLSTPSVVSIRPAKPSRYAHYNVKTKEQVTVLTTMATQSSFFNNKAKRFAKQQRSNIINALAYVYCYFLRAVRNGDHPNNNSYIVQLLTAAGPL